MREILFRGKMITVGEWVEGNYCHNPESNHDYISVWEDYVYSAGIEEVHELRCYYRAVTPETVGQYTGLTDMNGNKIFEGDIVWYDYEEERGVVSWDNNTARFIITCSTFTVDFDNVYGYELKVVGNIYDNSEMM